MLKKSRIDLKQYQEGIYEKKDNSQTTVGLAARQQPIISQSISGQPITKSHIPQGGLVAPISGCCVNHVGQMTAHGWIAGRVALSTLGDAFVIFIANSSLLCQCNLFTVSFH